MYTCEKHFAAEDIEICKYSSYKSCDLCFYLQFNFALFTVWPFYMLAVPLILMVNPSLNFTSFVLFTVQSVKLTKKKPRFGALPTLNMPQKSHETTKPAPRPSRSVVKDYEQPLSSSVYYKTFSELCQRVVGLKTINDWSHKLFADRLVLRKHVERFLLPELELIIDESLCYTVKVFGSFLVEDHHLYLRLRRSMRNVTVSALVKELEEYKLCGGVNACEMTSKLIIMSFL